MRPARRASACCGPTPGRRRFLADLGMGFTGLALGGLLFEDGVTRALPAGAADAVTPGKARSVIWLFMLGGASHLETFDPKPALHRYAGKTIAATPYARALQSPHLSNNFRPFA